MSSAGPRPTSKWVRKYLGFQKHYNFVLWSTLSGFLVLFSAYQLQLLDPEVFARKSSPGEWYWYSKGRYRVGIFSHLAGVLIAGILAPIQFLPRVRAKAIWFHRYSGYTIIALVIIGGLASLVIAPRAFGGTLDIQLPLIVLVGIVFTALFMAIYNIRRRNIDQHRRWMIRAMVWMSLIITERILLLTGAAIIGYVGGIYTNWTCDEALSVVKNTSELYSQFPACRVLGSDGIIAVEGRLILDSIYFTTAIRSFFGVSLWLAMGIHVGGTELYFSLTDEETSKVAPRSVETETAAISTSISSTSRSIDGVVPRALGNLVKVD